MSIEKILALPFTVLALFTAGACSKPSSKETPPAAPAAPSPAPAVTPAAPAAASPAAPAAPVAPPAPAERTLDELLAFPADGPPPDLAGILLGGPAPTTAPEIRLLGCGDEAAASVSWSVGADGKVALVEMEILCNEPEPGLTAEALAKRLSGWGKATTIAGRKAWRGARGTLTVADFDGFLRGTSSVVIDLVPPGETFVCGKDDGFAAIHDGLRRALSAGDAAYLAGVIQYPHAPVNGVEVADAADLKARFAEVFPPKERKALAAVKKPACNVGQETYWLDAGSVYLLIVRESGTWKVHGPEHPWHDTDLDPMAPR